jgi:gamma-glutamylcyclotransferase (GGCT)/AIG2-like uncharacterized protein YtfP
MSKEKEYTREFLHMMYNGTSTASVEDEEEIETYLFWTERQLLSRLEKIDKLEQENKELKFILSCEHEAAVLNIMERDEKNEELIKELKTQKETATEYSRQVLELEEYISVMNHRHRLDIDLDDWRKGETNPFNKSKKQ